MELKTVTREVYEKVDLPREAPRRSIYVVHGETPATEKGAQFDTAHVAEKRSACDADGMAFVQAAAF